MFTLCSVLSDTQEDATCPCRRLVVEYLTTSKWSRADNWSVRLQREDVDLCMTSSVCSSPSMHWKQQVTEGKLCCLCQLHDGRLTLYLCFYLRAVLITLMFSELLNEMNEPHVCPPSCFYSWLIISCFYTRSNCRCFSSSIRFIRETKTRITFIETHYLSQSLNGYFSQSRRVLELTLLLFIILLFPIYHKMFELIYM